MVAQQRERLFTPVGTQSQGGRARSKAFTFHIHPDSVLTMVRPDNEADHAIATIRVSHAR